MSKFDRIREVRAPNNDEGSAKERRGLDIESIKNWEKEGDKICVKKIESISTPLWCDGWYRNPSSGRSHNYGVATRNPKKHTTVILKGGSFFTDEKTKSFFEENSVSVDELYGGVSLNEAKKEYAIAELIQKQCKSLLNKKAPCPEPLEIQPVDRVINGRGGSMELVDFFMERAEGEDEKTNFTADNFVNTAIKLGIDVSYPYSEEVDEETKKDPFRWLFNQCIEKNNQGLYKYKIDGPNTRLVDLMTLEFADRKKYFIEANNAATVRGAVKNFAAKLGEFYGVLHKSNISYHSDASEHCSLADTTIAGVIMDIGGLTQNNDVDKRASSYSAQMITTQNMLAYLCTHVLKADEKTLESAMDVFWKKYKAIYTDENVEHFSKLSLNKPKNIRTQYFDVLNGGWIKLASDLKHLAWKD